MGSELRADRPIPRADTGEDAVWREAMPRIDAYLSAAGLTADSREKAVCVIKTRLARLLPLHPGENPVEVAMRQTVQWVEDLKPAPPPATPERALLAMPEQQIALRAWRWRGSSAAAGQSGQNESGHAAGDVPAGEGRPPASAAAKGIRGRRILFGSLIAATTAAAIALLSGSFQQDGLSPLEFVLVLLYAVLFAWICTAFWTAFAGFVIRWFGIRRFDLDTGEPASPPSADLPRSALIMPVYNETPRYVFARLRAIRDSLVSTGRGDAFDLFILSDTRDPDIQVEEERRWRELAAEPGAAARIFYRNRPENRHRKAGNIADFVRTFGGRYRYMTILDADSLMTGRALIRMLELMEAHPQVAVLQAPPVPVNNSSLFARLLQFAASLYGPLYTAGMNFWQAGDASYFGHNAMLRMQAFARHCGLPPLPGKEPLGGPILSHDFVEAATLRRAGWESWLLCNLDGSYEEIPPTLIDYAKRDRRWCQGNLQHARLVAAKGWRGLSRLHLGMAVMSYLASPLWFLFLLAAGAEAWLQSRDTPVYFFGDSLFPVWPLSYAFELMTVLLVTLTVLFLPKILALLLLLRRRSRWRLFGGPLRATASVVLESLFSVITAPVLMVFQSKFVVAILLRRAVGWPTQQREDRATTFTEAMSAHGSQLFLGIAAGLVTWFYVPNFFWWFTPVLAGLVLAVPVSVITSRSGLGKAAARYGLFLTPEEVDPPEVVRRFRQIVEEEATGVEGGGQLPWLSALLQPQVYNLHLRLAPSDEPSRRERHQLVSLMYTLVDEGEDALEKHERRAMLMNATCLRQIHIGLWSEMSLARLETQLAEWSPRRNEEPVPSGAYCEA